MATTAFVTEFQSYMSFQCKSSPSQLKLDQYKNYDHKMAPCQITESEVQQQDAEFSSISNPPETHQESSMSSMEASVESFSPEMNGIEDEKLPGSSFDDSDGVSNTSELQTQEKSRHHPDNQDPFYKSPETQMESDALMKTLVQKYSQQTSTNDSQNMSIDSRTDTFLFSNRYIKCNFCDYVPTSEQDYNSHSLIHFPFKCTICNYAARTEGRLKSHEMKFHSELPPNTWVGGRKPKANGREGSNLDENRPLTAKVKSRVTKCKLCNFVGASKLEYYRHLKKIHPDKALCCHKCEFATIYKHHLEYHIRNHFGSKPFKCASCNYSCVNKSMLNSHRKSHSNIYQFRCGACSYATKYCHSLKMHLRKYDHIPGKTLNPDGTPNTNSVIDVHGRRRGPKPKRKKQPTDSEVSQATTSTITPSSPTISYGTNVLPLQPSPAPQIYFHPQIYNNFAGSVFMRPPALDNSNCAMFQTPFLRKDQYTKCFYCDFVADSPDVLSQHLFVHATTDNPDLMNRYNLKSDSLFQLPARQYGFNYPSNGINFVDNIPRFEPRSIEARKVEALNNVPNGEVIHQMNGSVDKNERRMAGSPWRNTVVPVDAKNIQTPMVTTPFLNGIYNKTQINESPNVLGSRAEIDSPNAEQENHHSLESNHGHQDENVEALDLSCKNSGFEAMIEVERMDDNGSTSMTAINSSSSGQNGHYMPTPRHRRKGNPLRIDDYLPEDDPHVDFPSQEYWNQNMQPAEMSMVKRETLTARPNTNVTSHMSSLNCKSGGFRSNEELNEAFKKITVADIHQNGRLNNQQISFQKVKKDVSESQPPSCASPTTVDISMSNVVVKTEPIDVDSNTDTPRLSDIFRCQYCDLIFGEIKMYTTHMRYHTPGDPFTCGRCGVKCYDRVSLFDHFTYKIHPEEDEDVCITGVVRR